MKLVTAMVSAVVANNIISALETKAPFFCTEATYYDASLAAFPEHFRSVRIDVPVPELYAADITELMSAAIERHTGGGFVMVVDLHHHKRWT